MFYNSGNVIYLISSKNCEDQYIASAIDFKTTFRIHRSDIKTKKDRCGTASYFNTKSFDIQNPHRFFQIHIIESVVIDIDLEWIMAWTVSLIFMLVKEMGVIKNNVTLFIMFYLAFRCHNSLFVLVYSYTI